MMPGYQSKHLAVYNNLVFICSKTLHLFYHCLFEVFMSSKIGSKKQEWRECLEENSKNSPMYMYF